MLTSMCSPVRFLAPPNAMVGTEGLVTEVFLRIHCRASLVLQLALEFHLSCDYLDNCPCVGHQGKLRPVKWRNLP